MVNEVENKIKKYLLEDKKHVSSLLLINYHLKTHQLKDLIMVIETALKSQRNSKFTIMSNVNYLRQGINENIIDNESIGIFTTINNYLDYHINLLHEKNTLMKNSKEYCKKHEMNIKSLVSVVSQIETQDNYNKNDFEAKTLKRR